MPAVQLIMNAYHVQDFQVVSGPAWLNEDGFDIEAKGDPNATNAQVMLMLQSLLEDRFGLKYHRETRELPVYALTVARGGAKLPAPQEGGCVKMDGQVPAGSPGATLPVCGRLNMGMTAAGVRVRGGDVPMPELIRTLSTVLGRPMLDRTGITTTFDVRLEFKADDTTTGGLMAGWGSVAGHREWVAEASSLAGQPGAAPNIMVAVQEQLGLKLDSTKGPVEVLVIDRVEKPSGN
jgi:uncharacterized protein (TIGR03435 family)